MMGEVLDSRGVGEGGREGGSADPAPATAATVEEEETSFVHIYGGAMHKVPEGWTLPTLGALQMWQLWMLGNREQRVTALRKLSGRDLQHIDAATARREGRPVSKIRRAVKGFCELKFLMRYIEEKARERGAFHDNPNAAEVVGMYRAVNDALILRGDGRQSYSGRRDGQLLWTSMAKILRAKQRRLRRNSVAV